MEKIEISNIIREAFGTVIDEMQNEINDISFKTWLKPVVLALVEIDGKYLIEIKYISNDKFNTDLNYFETRYGKVIRERMNSILMKTIAGKYEFAVDWNKR